MGELFKLIKIFLQIETIFASKLQQFSCFLFVKRVFALMIGSNWRPVLNTTISLLRCNIIHGISALILNNALHYHDMKWNALFQVTNSYITVCLSNNSSLKELSKALLKNAISGVEQHALTLRQCRAWSIKIVGTLCFGIWQYICLAAINLHCGLWTVDCVHHAADSWSSEESAAAALWE